MSNATLTRFYDNWIGANTDRWDSRRDDMIGALYEEVLSINTRMATLEVPPTETGIPTTDVNMARISELESAITGAAQIFLVAIHNLDADAPYLRDRIHAVLELLSNCLPEVKEGE